MQIGTIVRLQVQRSSLKLGPRGARWYDPATLLPVPSLLLEAEGARGLPADGEPVLDVHHRTHPAGKNAGDNDLSLLFTAHYDLMRERFGERAALGVAGENILVETADRIALSRIASGVIIETADGRLAELEVVKVAEPCVEFTRYLLRRAPDARADPAFLAALDFLREGMRGFYCRYSGPALTVRPGDRVLLKERSG